MPIILHRADIYKCHIYNVAMKSNELREKFLKFFENLDHKIINSAPLVPEHDPTVLFTTAGMHPLVPFFLGEEHPSGKRLVNVQRCLRTDDIDEVGDETHNTFFEMLGNWSMGDYWKKESIAWSYEFLTKILKLPTTHLAVTIFAGDSDAPSDTESKEIWLSLGINENRIEALGKKDNWWGPAGMTGPCGPDTEIFYWTGSGDPVGRPSENNSWVEIWNNVFMQYDKSSDGSFSPLKQKSVDTGMGLERMLAVLNKKDNIYETDVFESLFKIISAHSDLKENVDKNKSARIIADHIRAASVLAFDGVYPSNKERGYISRRLIRRAVRAGREIGFSTPENFAKLTEEVAKMLSDDYKFSVQSTSEAPQIIATEVKKFLNTVSDGLKYLDKKISQNSDLLTGSLEEISSLTFFMFETFGFPMELTYEELKKKDSKIDIKKLDELVQTLFKAHQEKSRTVNAGQFKGGLADHSDQSRKLHTATHLLHQAVRTVLGDQAVQKGSNITPERLRFDFSHPKQVTPEELKQIEDLVNEQIEKDLKVEMKVMPKEEAQKSGAIGVFNDQYGDIVKVYSMGDFSKEFCGGPHADSTGQLNSFKIEKEKSASAGIRRIYATID